MINKLAQEIHKNNKIKGFYDEPKNIGEMLALIHSEVSEALEADREDKYTAIGGISDPQIMEVLNEVPESKWRPHFEVNVKNTFEDELADIVIRVMDLAAFKSIDLEAHIKAKMRYNSLRPHKHGKKY